MIYQIEFKPRALKDLKGIDRAEGRRVIEKITLMENDLAGDVKAEVRSQRSEVSSRRSEVRARYRRFEP